MSTAMAPAVGNCYYPGHSRGAAGDAAIQSGASPAAAPSTGIPLDCHVSLAMTNPPSLRGAKADVAIQPPFIEPHNISAWVQYTLQVPHRDSLQAHLKAADIPTAVHYPIPLNQQSAVADPSARLPVGDAVAQRVVSLPMHPYLDAAAQQCIAEAVTDFLASNQALGAYLTSANSYQKRCFSCAPRP